MPARNDHHRPADPSEACRGNCSGYGSKCCCPPLIVLAMRSQHSSGQHCHHCRSDEGDAATAPEYLATGLASREFCNCMFSYRAHEAGTKMEM
jgi:hypothetical protein